MAAGPWVVKDLIKAASDFLETAHIDSPRLTAEVLLAHQLGTTRVGLYMDFDQPIRPADVAGFRSLIRRRLNREPLQYITGIKEFWSLDFIVDPRVLIPRPETELLVEVAIEKSRSFREKGVAPVWVLELGTGSGAIAVSLAQALPGARIIATDVFGGALEIARLNASRHDVSERIELLQGDLWAPLKRRDVGFHVVVSNPPYVRAADLEGLPPEVRDHEPRAALDGGETGMDCIERIIREAPDYLHPGGWLLVEMAPDQTERALALVSETKGFLEATRLKDFARRFRVVIARRKDKG